MKAFLKDFDRRSRTEENTKNIMRLVTNFWLATTYNIPEDPHPL